MIRALLHSADRFVEHAGGLSILALDGILLIPLVFAAFFFPLAVLGGVVAIALLSAIAFAVTRSVQAHHHRHGTT
jgi:hypothetical protein